MLYALDVCGGTELACNDDMVGLQSEIQVYLTTGQSILLVVDGYAVDSGPMVLTAQ